MHKSKLRKPIIPISSIEIAEIPLDSFDFKPTPKTIVPEIITLPSTITTKLSTIENLINLQNNQTKQINQKNENIKLENSENIKIPVPSPSIIQPEVIQPEQSTQSILLNINNSTNLSKVKNIEKMNINETKKIVEKLNNKNQIDSELEDVFTSKVYFFIFCFFNFLN